MRAWIMMLCLGCTLLGGPSLLAQASEEQPLSEQEISQLTRAAEHQERDLKKFRSLVRNLEMSVKQSSQASRRQVIGNLEEAMGQEILRVEEAVSEHHLIMRHGQEVEQLKSTDQVGSAEVKVRENRKWRRQPTEENAPSEAVYYLARMQRIYTSCQTIRENTIAKQSNAVDQYLNSMYEFADLMEVHLQVLQAEIPKPAEVELKEEPDSDAEKPTESETAPAVEDTTSAGAQEPEGEEPLR